MASPELQAFNSKQNGIYDKFRAAQAAIETEGLQVDQAGTAPQSGFLVAFRPPAFVGSEIFSFSRALNEAVPSIVYGFEPGTLNNDHITVSDYGLAKGRRLDIDDKQTAETIERLAMATKRGMDYAGMTALRGSRVRLDGVRHNGKVGIIPGQASEGLLAVRNSILTAAAEDGIEGFNGAWGAHSTVNRVLEAQEPGSDAVHDFQSVLEQAPKFGEVAISVVDVGYFNMDPAEDGFVYTPIERFKMPGVNLDLHD